MHLVDGTSASVVEVSSNVVESRAGVGSDRLNRGQANDNDQSQHNGVLNRRWAVFRNQETLDFGSKTFHIFLQSIKSKVPGIGRGRENATDFYKLGFRRTDTR